VSEQPDGTPPESSDDERATTVIGFGCCGGCLLALVLFSMLGAWAGWWS